MCLPGSNLARIRAPILSLYTVALNVNSLCLVNLRPFVAHSIMERSGIADRSACESVIYSDSVVLVAIVICIVDTHSTGQLAISIMYAVQDLTQSGFALFSTPQPQANAVSTKTSVLRERASSGFKINPLSAVPLR